jgi:hypothetical protein
MMCVAIVAVRLVWRRRPGLSAAVVEDRTVLDGTKAGCQPDVVVNGVPAALATQGNEAKHREDMHPIGQNK